MEKRYPHAAGYSEQTTSRDAAEKVEASGRAPTIRERVLRLFQSGDRLTAEEAADRLRISYRSVQPRISELHHAGLIKHDKRVDGPQGMQIWQWKLKETNNGQ